MPPDVGRSRVETIRRHVVFPAQFGLIAGNLVTTVPLGLMMIQEGTAWDNAKKYVEKGHLGGIGTKTHEATIVGDTVEDPPKDAAGPSLGFLMNLIGSMSILFASSFMVIALIH